MTEMEKLLAEQKQGASALALEPDSPGLRLWLSDLVAEEVLMLQEEM